MTIDALGQLKTALSERYEVLREIGAGGMATVFLARDLRHDRHVALKVLKPELGAVLGVERFLSEIKVTANLQHPNLLPLFDSGEAKGLLFYVMPYVEGESLRARLDREKQLPVDEAIRIATGVAAALDYAHRHGVIHRDLKPENILLQDGQPVIADFGIALAVSNAGGNRITATGLSLGTPQYMSPEQATGDRAIDGRTDIYSLGAMTYEMLVGDPPYMGGTTQAVIAKLLTEKPRGVRLSRANVPGYVEAAIEHALEKLPADRFATAHEFSEALHGRGAAITTGSGTWSGAATPERSQRGRSARVAVGVLALAVAAIAGALLSNWLRPKAEVPIRPMVRFGIELPPDAEPMGATGSTIAFSPDGARIVYVGRSKSGVQLYWRGLDQLNPTPIPGSEGGTLPFFSSNGQWVGFKQGNRIAKVALAGGPVTPVGEAPGSTYGATWTASDTIIFASDSGLMEVAATGGRARVVARNDTGASYRWPEILPGDRALLFAIVSPKSLHLAVFDRRKGTIRRLQQSGSYPQYVESGFVVFSDPGGIVSTAPFDLKRLDVTGGALPIAEKLSVGYDGDRNMGVSRSGAIAYQASVYSSQRLVLVDRSGTVRDAGIDSGFYVTPQFSPDGKRVALTRFTSLNYGASDVWVIDLAQRTRTRLTFDTVSGFPRWTPDGKRIAFTRFSDFIGGEGNILWTPSDGSGAPDSVVVKPGGWFANAFLPGGRVLLYQGQPSRKEKSAIWQLALDPGATAQPALANAFDNCCVSMSPDGRWFAYQSEESGRPEVYVRPFPGPGGRWQVSLDGGFTPVWSPTGREIFYSAGDRMIAATVRTEGSFEVGTRTPLFTSTPSDLGYGYDVTPDGRTFVMIRQVRRGEEQTVVVMLNWFDQLRARGARAGH